MKIHKFLLFTCLFFTAGVDAQTLNIDAGCNSEGKEIISAFQLTTYAPSDKARTMLGFVMDVAGATQNFEFRYANVENVLATTDSGKRYLLSSPTFLKNLEDEHTFWGAYFLLAHEIGHHLKKHDFGETNSERIKYLELEADVFAGAALRALGAKLDEAKRAVETLPMLAKSEKRPAKVSRIEAMLLGWKRQDKKIGPEPVYDGYPVRSEYLNIQGPSLYLARHNQNINEPSTYALDKPIYFLSLRLSSRLSNMPKFPWPPPKCYLYRTLVKDLTTKAEDFDDVDKLLQLALDKQGYTQRSYYQTPGGFALVTQMEQFNQDGSIKARFRFEEYPTQDDFNGLWEYLQSLVMPQPGRFRVFVFVVSNESYTPSENQISQAEAQGLVYRGINPIPLGYSNMEITQSHHLDVLIYEFEAPQSTKRCEQKCPTSLDVRTHLQKSGLSTIGGF